jgi:hypothetical protein
MPERTEQILIDGPVPVSREAKDAPLFLILPGSWIHPTGHPEDPVSLLLITRHRATSLVPGLAWHSPGIRTA